MTQLYRIAARLDPRTKLLLALASIVVMTFTANVATLAIELVVAGVCVVLLGVVRAWLKMLRLLLPTAAFFVLVTLFSLDVTLALAGALRLIALGTVFFIFFQTTLPEDLANALVKLGAPFAFAFILTAAMQFVPVLARQTQDIVDAQRARGIRLERDLPSLRHYAALFAPLLIQSFTLADQLAEAMEARGLGAPRRTFSEEYAFRGLDFIALGVGFLLLVAVWQFR